MGKTTVLYLAAVTFLTLVLLQPFSLHLGDSVVNVIDPLFYAWNLHHNAGIVVDGWKNALDTNIFYPLTNTIAYSDTLWSQSLFTSPIIWATGNSILAENVLVVFSFVLSAAAMYMLSYYVTKHQISSMIAGLFFAFSYPRIAQIGHLPFVSSHWIPFVVLYTLKFFDQGNIRYLLAAYICYVLAITSSVYFGIFLLPTFCAIIIVYVYIWHYSGNNKELLKRIKIFLVWVIPFIFGLLFVNYPYFRLFAEYPEYKRTLFDTMDLRAFPIDFISVLPQSLLHRLGLPAASPEHVLYPTLTLITMSVYGAYIAWKNNKKIFFVCIISGFLSLVLSFGAELNVGSKNITMPYYYLFVTIPLFQIIRAPARLGIFVILSLAILSSIGLKYFIAKKHILGKAATILIIFLFEIWQLATPYVSVPRKNDIPPVYRWLKDQPSNTVIAELPLRLFYTGNAMKEQLMKRYTDLNEMDNYALETYRMYFSTFHSKRMVNGYSGFFPASYNELAADLQAFPNEKAFSILKDKGVTTIVAHQDQFNRDPRDIESTLNSRPDLRFVIQFGDTFVYEFIKK